MLFETSDPEFFAATVFEAKKLVVVVVVVIQTDFLSTSMSNFQVSFDELHQVRAFFSSLGFKSCHKGERLCFDGSVCNVLPRSISPKKHNVEDAYLKVFYPNCAYFCPYLPRGGRDRDRGSYGSFYVYLSLLMPNTFSSAGSQCFPYRLIPEVRKSILKELGLTRDPLAPRGSVLAGIPRLFKQLSLERLLTRVNSS